MQKLAAVPIAEDQFPTELRGWLMLEDSMTAAIAERFGQNPLVEVHYSGVDKLSSWEAQCLRASASSSSYARHISLNINAQPVLLARSVTIHNSAIEPLLSQLQQTPLASVLFEDEQWLRVDAPQALVIEPALFGRACVWLDQRTGERLLVEEFFNFQASRQA